MKTLLLPVTSLMLCIVIKSTYKTFNGISLKRKQYVHGNFQHGIPMTGLVDQEGQFQAVTLREVAQKIQPETYHPALQI